MRVAIKYCGGCDPTFDRGEFADLVKEVAGAQIAWVDFNQEGKDAMLVICGCPKACPVDELQDMNIAVVVTSDDVTPEIVVDRILRKGKSDEN